MSEVSGTAAEACSFCGKKRKEVLCLVLGPTASICDECIKVAADIAAGYHKRDPGADVPDSGPDGRSH